MRLETTPYQEGDTDSAICIIAEAPAVNEMRKGRPLVGESGKVFDSLLHAAGITRRRCLIHNVSREQISSGKELMDSKGNLTLKGEKCRDDLRERLAGSKANVFVPMGAVAARILMGEHQITKWRGSPVASSLLLDREVIPTIHPAATLRHRGNYLWRYDIISDFRKALEHSTYAGLKPRTRDHVLDPGFRDVTDELHRLQDSAHVAYDIECYNHQVSCMSFAASAERAICIPFLNRWTLEEEQVIWRMIGCLLEDTSISNIIQNSMFEASFLLLRNGIRIRGPILDPMIAFRIMYPDFKSSLEYMTSIFTDMPYYKDDKKLWSTPYRDQFQFWLYNSRDSISLYEIAMEHVFPELAESEVYTHMYAMDMQDKFDVCLYMSSLGMKVEEDRIEVYKKDLTEQIAEVEAQLEEQVGPAFNPGSPKQVMAHFYGTLGIKPYMNRKTRRPSSDDKALMRIFRKYNLPEAKAILRYRNLSKLKGTYVDVGYDADKRFRCFYNIRGTKTGRLSSSKTVFGTGTNMQNLDPRFKGFLECDDAEESVRQILEGDLE